MMILFHQESPHRNVSIQPDLILEIGQFFVTSDGIAAMFRPPLEKLSSFYTWRAWPFGLSATRTLVKGEDGSVLGRLSDRIGLSMAEMDMLNLEEVDRPREIDLKCMRSIEADSDALMTWSLGLVKRCPILEVSDALARLALMNMREIDQYVATFL